MNITTWNNYKVVGCAGGVLRDGLNMRGTTLVGKDRCMSRPIFQVRTRVRGTSLVEPSLRTGDRDGFRGARMAGDRGNLTKTRDFMLEIKHWLGAFEIWGRRDRGRRGEEVHGVLLEFC